MLQDALYGLGLHDGSDHAHAAVAPGALPGVADQAPAKTPLPAAAELSIFTRDLNLWYAKGCG
jgi:hypothetical protein